MGTIVTRTHRTLVAMAALAVFAFLAPKPAADEAPATVVLHYLPFPAGTTYNVWQGNDQGPSHNDKWNRHAFDFSPMPEGSPICATADGAVIYVKEDSSGPTGKSKDNNEVAILHPDGTVGTYLHLMKDGATVKVGDGVYAGDVIGKAGNTGRSKGVHLHFGLRGKRRLGPSVPCRFQDVPGGGVPKKNDKVTSANLVGRALAVALEALAADYDDACALHARESMARVLKALPKRAPRRIEKALESLGDRRDFVERWTRHRDALLARHHAEAESMLEALVKARGAAEIEHAVYLATIGKKEFASLDERKAFHAALDALKKVEGYKDALKAMRPRLSLRAKIVRTIRKDREMQEKALRGKRVRWKDLLRSYDQTVKAASACQADEIARRLTARRAAVAGRLN